MIAKQIRTAILLFVSICVIVVILTSFVTLVAQTVMPDKANGSLLYVDGKIVGSELIGQSFTSPGYFHGRPSAVNYNGGESGGSNLGPTSARLMEEVSQRIEQVRRENNLSPEVPVPADLVLASGSGLDPHISVESALLQVPRVAQVRGLLESEVKALVEKHIEPPQFGILGQTKINVLKLNIALDELAKNSVGK